MTNGKELLAEWLDRTGSTQVSIAEQLRNPDRDTGLAVYRSLVNQWKQGGKCPNLADAVRLQMITDGGVPAVSWGYPATEVESLLRAAVGLTTAHGIAGAASGVRAEAEAS